MDHVGALRDEVRELMRAVRLLKQRHERPGELLGVIGRLQPSHLKALAARCSLDQSTTSRAVAALERDGLVRRLADPHDRRACFIELTEDGRAALKRSEAWYAAALSGVLREWAPAEVERLAVLLRRFTHDLNQHDLNEHDLNEHNLNEHNLEATQ